MQNIIKIQKEYLNKNSQASVQKIKTYLIKLKNNIIKYENELYSAFKLDFNKPKQEVFLSEYLPVIKEINWFIKKLRKIHKKKLMFDKFWLINEKSYAIRKQYGICLIYAPYNYVFNLALTPLVGAIALNNTVILKTASFNKNVNLVIEKIIKETFEENVCFFANNIENVNEKLMQLNVDLVFFTGSETVGKKILENFSKQLIPVILELGGKCPCIVDKQYNPKITAKRIAWAKLLNCSQTCVAVDYLIVHKDIKDKLVTEIINELNNMIKNENDVANLINYDHYVKYSSSLKQEEILYSFKLKNNLNLILVDINNLDHMVMKTELFCPILPIITYENENEIYEIIKQNNNPLALYLFSENKQLASNIFYNVNSGSLVVNETIIQLTKKTPFGGIKNSGIGQYHKWHSVNCFSQLKPFVKGSKLNIEQRFAPYNEKKIKFLKKFA